MLCALPSYGTANQCAWLYTNAHDGKMVTRTQIARCVRLYVQNGPVPQQSAPGAASVTAADDTSCRVALLPPTLTSDQRRRSSAIMHSLSSDNDAANPAGVPSVSSQHRHRKSRRKSRVPSSPEDDDDDELEYERNNGDPGISSALEMLPIPCAISGPTGLPAILLVNPPSTAAVCGTPEDDGGAALTSMPTTAEVQLASETKTRHEFTKSLISRLSVTRINFYMRYLPTGRGRKDRSATKRERKATKTLAIVLG